MLTNDGNAILREIDVTHPAAKVRFAPRITPKKSNREEDETSLARKTHNTRKVFIRPRH